MKVKEIRSLDKKTINEKILELKKELVMMARSMQLTRLLTPLWDSRKRHIH